jgi:hypothetical protein
MPASPFTPVDPELMLQNFMDLAGSHRDEALESWSRGCDLYARYFAALAKARDPEAVMAAHAELMKQSMEAFADRASKTTAAMSEAPPGV